MNKTLPLFLIRAWSHTMPRPAGRWLATRFLTPSRRRRPDPADAMRRDLGDGGVLWSIEAGAKKALLIHGWSGYRGQFDKIVMLLVEQKYSVHLIDPPGHGAAVPGRSNPERFVRAIEQAVDLVGAPDLAIGHSMGGAALLHLTVGDRPDIAGRIVTVSAPHGVRHPMAATAKMAGFGKRATEHFVAAVEGEVGVSRGAFDVLPRAPRARVPLTVIHDRNDPQIPFDHAEAIAAAWPGAELIETSGAGHNRTLQAPETLAAIEALITETASKRAATTHK